MNKFFRLSGAKWLAITLDCMIIMVSYLFTIKLLFVHNELSDDIIDYFMHIVPWLGGLIIITFRLFDLYNFSGRREYAKSMYNIIIAHVMVAVELVVIDYFFQVLTLPDSVVISAFCIQLMFIFGLRSLLFLIQSRGIGKKRAMIIVDDPETAKTIIEKMLYHGKNWFEVKGMVAASDWRDNISESSLANIDLCLLSHDIAPDIKTEIARFAGSRQIEVLVVPELYDVFLMGAELQQIDDMLVYSIMPPGLGHLEKMMKRSVDLIVSVIMLVLASPIMLLMMLLIPGTSKGKALFMQERIGLNGKTFKVIKFRTMTDDAEKNTGPVLAADQDARITKLGNFIRSTRIDELPQLFNVIRGDMSLVGPRPEREFFVNEFKKQIPHYTYRLMVKPGLTGLAQVRAKYSTSSLDKLRYDLMYIKKYSPLLDLMVLFQTIIVVLQRQQSKGVQTDDAGITMEKPLFNAEQEVAVMQKQGA